MYSSTRNCLLSPILLMSLLRYPSGVASLSLLPLMNEPLLAASSASSVETIPLVTARSPLALNNLLLLLLIL